MNPVIPESELPETLTVEQAVDAAYNQQLSDIVDKLRRGLPTLIECEKELAPFLYINIRQRLKQHQLQCVYLDGRPRSDGSQPSNIESGFYNGFLSQLRNAVRGAVDRRVVVLPHIDLLASAESLVTRDTQEVVALLYENPELLWLGFKDPTLRLPGVIENLFTARLTIQGIPRDRLRYVITQREARKFGRQFSPWQLYKYVSGLNAVRLRKLLSTLEGEDYPSDPKRVYAQLRQATLTGSMEIPHVDIDRDIGGYERVKARLKAEIIDLLIRRDRANDPNEIARLEELIPRGIIFWGPPGTGKTLFAKAIASSIGAAIIIVSGPELKTKWYGESERNLRRVFHQARSSAPSIIVFDEIDSFAVSRARSDHANGADHSMVNQLLTEMDGFHKGEQVYVVATTNFVESLDPALLRPGRFEFLLHIPYPDDEDRRAILSVYDRKLQLNMTPEALDYAVRRTGDNYLTSSGTPFSGDHLNALCRAVARLRLRRNLSGPTEPHLIDQAMLEFEERRTISEKDAELIATHEAGHLLVSIFCTHHPPPEKVTIEGEIPWAPFFTRYKIDKQKISHKRAELMDIICVLYGGIEAERLIYGDVSTGASGNGDPRSDLARATELATLMVEACGMSELPAPLRVFRDQHGRRDVLSGGMADAIDRQINAIIVEAQHRAARILHDHRDELIAVRDELLQKKTIEGKRMQEIIKGLRKRYKSKSMDMSAVCNGKMTRVAER